MFMLVENVTSCTALGMQYVVCTVYITTDITVLIAPTV